MTNTLANGEQYANSDDFIKGVDLSVWEMGTACGSCHIGGGLVEFDRTGTRLSMRRLNQPLNAYDWYAYEMYNPTSGMPEKYNSNMGANMPVNMDGSPASVVPGFGAAQAMWRMPATSDFKPLASDGSNAVVPAMMVPPSWTVAPWVNTDPATNPLGADGAAMSQMYINLGMAVEGQAVMPNVREMDCLFCHMEGYNNIISSAAVQMGYFVAAPSLGSGLMNMFTFAYDTSKIDQVVTPMGTMAYLKGDVVAKIKPEPPAANCRQCHIPTTMANFSDMFDKFLAAAPMSYNPASPMASAINGMVMPTYDLNAALLAFAPPGPTASPAVYLYPLTSTWWFYGDNSPANGPFGIFPTALDMNIDVLGTAMAGGPVGGGKPIGSGPLYYDQNDGQNGFKKSTIPFPRADFFKRGDNWDDANDDVHYDIGCAGCHFNTNAEGTAVAGTEALTQCDPGRGFSTMGGVENGSGPLKIDTRSTVKRCQDCHVTGKNFEGKPIETFSAPNPTAAHTAAGLMGPDVQAVKLADDGTEEPFLGNHLDAIACQVCHVKKDKMAVRSLDSTSGNRYPSIIGFNNTMIGMFTDPMGTGSVMFPSSEWKPLYGWDEREQKKLPGGSWNPDWRREIIPINMIVAYMWNDFGDADQNGDGAEAYNAANPGSEIPIVWDPPIMRDMKAGMNFAPGPFATIPIGFGGAEYQSAYNPDGNLNGSFDYVGIYGGNVMLTNANEISAYKTWRENIKSPAMGGNGKSWVDTKLTLFGGNPFQIEHGVTNASSALGANGCTDCHSASSGFFSGGYDMVGTAIPGTPTSNPLDLFMRPAVPVQVTGYTADLTTGSEAMAKFDSVSKAKKILDVKFEEDGTWDPTGKTFTPGETGANALRTTDLSRSEYLYPHPESQSWGDFYYAQPDLKGKTFSSLEERVAYLESINMESIHTATPGSGSVVIFPDNGHDDAGWVGSKPYFAVTVDCTLCHDTNLKTIHGNNCATCHPGPRDTFVTWSGGCQQGGCHTVFHEDSVTAHESFDDAYDAGNDCLRCHVDNTWDVVQAKCLNCHAAPTTGYGTTPVTTSNAQSSYDGTALIKFSISENGKVGIGNTFYKLDFGAEASGSKVLVTAPGSHHLEFWSVDQYGVSEVSHNTVDFAIVEDIIPPTTTSDAKSTYYQGGIIHLSATDDSTRGVQNTFYTLNNGPTQSGSTIVLPTTPGVITYTLNFWSVDCSGNTETKHTVTFTVTSGNGTIRLVWWDCDWYPSQKPTGSDKASWEIHKDSLYGPLVKSGSGASPSWSGINDIPMPIGGQKYFVRVKWWDSYEGYYENTDIPNVYVTTPGQVVRLSY